MDRLNTYYKKVKSKDMMTSAGRLMTYHDGIMCLQSKAESNQCMVISDMIPTSCGRK